ncbi:hypothetical protein [Streptomyces griseoluteus]|uniref:hypothetical protein n=1 Tax=Streptomyces griseoluteus TaxID=29306 RepID=UPI003700CBD6
MTGLGNRGYGHAKYRRLVGRNPRPAPADDADAWVGNEGRVVSVRQKLHFASGLQSSPPSGSTATLAWSSFRTRRATVS